MNGPHEQEGGYAVPTYKAPRGAAWFHFLHGNVPGHEIDFMYRSEVPHGPLTRQHFSHLSRLIKYIEPQTNEGFAFAIGNLSRDDTQHEPGHGGLAMIFGLRIHGVTDHAGRQDPPFAHGIVCVDRNLDEATLLRAALSFHDHMFSASPNENPSTVLYREYVRCAATNPAALPHALRAYVEDFADLPAPVESALSWKWLANEASQPKRVVIVHPNNARFDSLARCAAKIGAMLYQSNIKWSAITNGRESDIPSGVSIRLVAERDASSYVSSGLVLQLGDVPDDEAEIATQIFRANLAERAPQPVAAAGWRERLQSSRAASGPASNPPPPMASGESSGVETPVEAPDSGGKYRYGAPAEVAPAVTGLESSESLSAQRGAETPSAFGANDAATANAPTSSPAEKGVAEDSSLGPKKLVASPSTSFAAGDNAPPDAGIQPPAAAADDRPKRSLVWLWVGLGLACAGAALLVVLSSTPETPPPAPSPTAAGTGAQPAPSPAPSPSPPPVPEPTTKPQSPATTSTAAPETTTTPPEKSPPKGGKTVKDGSRDPRKTPGSTTPTNTPTSSPTPKPQKTSDVFNAPLQLPP